MRNRASQQGFTIVELLIVIVVIGILAAITVVAYNGIQNRAKVAATQSAVSQVAKKVMAYAVDNSDQYPASLAAVGVADSGDTTYQYSVNNTSTPKTYCITVTTGSTSYYSSNSVPVPTSGGCAGHGQGGVAAITNLIPNPNMTSAGVYWTNYGTGGVGAESLGTTAPMFGTTFKRTTWSTAPTGTVQSGVNFTPDRPIVTGATYFFSIYLRQSWSGSQSLFLMFKDAGGTGITQVQGTFAAVTPNIWTRFSVSATAPTNAASFSVWTHSNSSLPPSGGTLDTDGAMLTQGTALYGFADGNSSNWIWNGTVNNSTSTGPSS
ncbi:MAG: type II secretion system protein [Candidatus Microsaccharimonas sp.]